VAQDAIHTTWLVQKENGGSVESLYTEWLRDKGHDGMPLVKQ